jgi:hypothetical protein
LTTFSLVFGGEECQFIADGTVPLDKKDNVIIGFGLPAEGRRE